MRVRKSCVNCKFFCRKNQSSCSLFEGVMRILVNQKELSEILGITPRWVQKLSKENGMFMHRKKNKYILSDCVKEYIEYKIEVETTGGNDPDYWKEKAKHEYIKRQISEQKLSRMKRESFDAADVEDAWSYIILNFKNKLLSFPHKLATLIVNESSIFKITGIINAEFDILLNELSNFSLDDIESGDECFDDDEDTEIDIKDSVDAQAAKKTNRK